MDPKLMPGSRVASRYRLERALGEGGMGVVWEATHEITRKRVALKLVKRADAPGQHTRLLREARAACAVHHPHVREVYDVLEDEDGSPVMVMEYLAGESLADRLEREGKLALSEAAALVLPVISAVGTAHALGIIHRDLKPENIFVVGGPPQTVKVLDFGIAKLTASEGAAAATGTLTSSGALLGTPYYMSPEQTFGEKDLDHRTDVWALGLILYRCLSGILPTQADNIGQVFKNIVARPIRPLERLAPDLPSDITSLVGRMLSRARDERPFDLHEVADVLARYTSVAVPGFGAPSWSTAPAEGASSSPGAAIAPVDPLAETVDPLAETAAASPGPAGDTADTTTTAADVRPAFGMARVEEVRVMPQDTQGERAAVPEVRTPARRRRRMAAMTMALAASIALALGSWSARVRTDQAPATTSTPALPTPVSTPTEALGSVAKAPSAAQAPEPVRRAALRIVPADASVRVDGKQVEVREDGTVLIAGELGSVPLFIRHMLRQAAEDNPEIGRRFFASDAPACEPRVDPALVEHLLRRAYPTNVRELGTLLWSAMMGSPGDRVMLTDELREQALSAKARHRPRADEPTAEEILGAVHRHENNLTRAARTLGLPSRFVLYRLMKKLGIDLSTLREEDRR